VNTATCRLARVDGLSLFRGLVRSMDMMGGTADFTLIMQRVGVGRSAEYWEGRLALDSDVAQLRGGDLEALSNLLTRYQNRLYRYLLRLVREPVEAEDLFQQSWLRVAEKIRQYDPKRNFESWLFTLARNLAIDHLRRIRPESLDQPGADAGGETAAARLPSHERPPIEEILARERAGRLGAALEMLPMVQREVLTLRLEEEMKLEEIAEVLDAPLSTVKTRLRRALERLRATLVATYPGENWQ
jgi:RNA polymerase sigma-70 factor, ECF subfamily